MTNPGSTGSGKRIYLSIRQSISRLPLRHATSGKNSFIVDIIITNFVIQEKSRNGATDDILWSSDTHRQVTSYTLSTFFHSSESNFDQRTFQGEDTLSACTTFGPGVT
jgi:hypothetical protein